MREQANWVDEEVGRVFAISRVAWWHGEEPATQQSQAFSRSARCAVERAVPPAARSARGQPLAGYFARVTSRKAKLDARDSSTVSHSSQCMDALDGRPWGGFAANAGSYLMFIRSVINKPLSNDHHRRYVVLLISICRSKSFDIVAF